MKKKNLLCLLIAILTLSITTICYADLPDITSLSDEELVLLKTNILDEMIKRDLVKEVEVPGGRYTVGTDIPAGAYSIEIRSMSTNLTVWGSAYGDYSSDGGLLLNEGLYSDDNPKLGKVALEDGNVIDFGKTLYFSRFTGLGF